MLIVFSGLPGSGKTSIASRLARELSAVYLRIDSLEMGLVRSGMIAGPEALGPAGYYAAHAVALDNLENGMTVIADSVNPLAMTRDAWLDVAVRAAVPCLEVEVLCSDAAEHKKRVEERRSDIQGLCLPTWRQIQEREYEPWNRERLVLDTAVLTREQAVAVVKERVGKGGGAQVRRNSPGTDRRLALQRSPVVKF